MSWSAIPTMRDAGDLLGVPYLGTDSVLEKMIAENGDCCAAVGVGKVTLKRK